MSRRAAVTPHAHPFIDFSCEHHGRARRPHPRPPLRRLRGAPASLIAHRLTLTSRNHNHDAITVALHAHKTSPFVGETHVTHMAALQASQVASYTHGAGAASPARILPLLCLCLRTRGGACAQQQLQTPRAVSGTRRQRAHATALPPRPRALRRARRPAGRAARRPRGRRRSSPPNRAARCPRQGPARSPATRLASAGGRKVGSC